ncbi:hypothetical protein Pmani_026128 [Petrolisthes manimaculis]|uniref:Uncharacterized protein n=1 Tax=Petrolisthes manimaculis TaxID=1843537 RepID=A0AAE1P6T0_9EUCA|nr:hypothetical protein Pmani_026128 [Petrolisthes manimaculis]
MMLFIFRVIDYKAGYHWDRYDLRGSRSLLTQETPHLTCCCWPKIPTPRHLLTHTPYCLLDNLHYGHHLSAGGEEGEGAAGSEATAATPMLSVDARDSQEVYDDDEDNDDDDDDPCSFEEILLANNITLVSTPDLAQHLCPNYNMISELEDDEPPPPPPPPPPPSNKVPLSPAKTSNLPAASEDVNKLGSPRSRRPFHRRDYSRVSDVSFLSALEEECVETVDESFSEPQDSDWEPPNDLNDPQAAKLIQTSLSEVYL